MLAHVERGFLDQINDTKNINFYPKGATIFYENNYPLGLFAIYKGKVKIFKTTENGKEYILRLAKEGEVLGYRSLITGEKYEVSAQALEDTHVCFLSSSCFMNLLKQSNGLTKKVMESLSQELKIAEARLADMTQKSVKERVAETLLMLRNFYGLEDDNKTIKANLSREDLANMVGTATETLIRSLAEFKEKKIVDLKGKKIILLNLSLLKSIANVQD